MNTNEIPRSPREAARLNHRHVSDGFLYRRGVYEFHECACGQTFRMYAE